MKITKFNECMDIYEVAKRNRNTFLTWEDFYFNERQKFESNFKAGDEKERARISRTEIQYFWRKSRRPFFNLYPIALQMLLKTSLNIRSKDLPTTEEGFVCICIPCGSINLEHGELTNVFYGLNGGNLCTITRVRLKETEDFQSITSFAGKEINLSESAGYKDIYSFAGVKCYNFSDEYRIGLQIAVGTIILASQPEMVDRVLLSKDVLKGRHGPDAERRALQRGINGRSIGKNLEGQSHEVSGHIRRPHFAIRWTEKGRKTPRLVPVKGSVVNRSKLTTVPTGYVDDIEKT